MGKLHNHIYLKRVFNVSVDAYANMKLYLLDCSPRWNFHREDHRVLRLRDGEVETARDGVAREHPSGRGTPGWRRGLGRRGQREPLATGRPPATAG